MRPVLALILTLAAATPALAQPDTLPAGQPGEQLWDGVIAVVGDTVLLRSDLLLAVEQLRAGGQTVPEDPEQFGRFLEALMQERIGDLLLIEGARAAGITVDQAEVDQAVNDQVAQVRGRFPSDAAFQQALAESGRSLETYRTELARQFLDQTLAQRFIRQRVTQMAPAAISEDDIRAYFEANRGRLGARPASVTFQQVVIRPQPGQAARDSALRVAEQVLRELGQGTEFDVLARRYGTDGTRERGGDLGWFRQGQMVREFDLAVFAMRAGQVAGPIETEFGFHIIKLERVRAGERQARHILIRPTITEADVAAARQRADSVAQAIRGGANPAELAARYNTPDAARYQSNVPLDQLPPAFLSALEPATPGQVVGPVPTESGAGSSFVVVRLVSRQAGGEWTLDAAREQIRRALQDQRQVERLMEELRATTYVSIRM